MSISTRKLVLAAKDIKAHSIAVACALLIQNQAFAGECESKWLKSSIEGRRLDAANSAMMIEAVNLASRMKPEEFEAVASRFHKSMLDKGHRSWREGKQAEFLKAGKSADEPVPKPVPPKGGPNGSWAQEYQGRIAALLALPEAQRERALAESKMKIDRNDKGEITGLTQSGARRCDSEPALQIEWRS